MSLTSGWLQILHSGSASFRRRGCSRQAAQSLHAGALQGSQNYQGVGTGPSNTQMPQLEQSLVLLVSGKCVFVSLFLGQDNLSPTLQIPGISRHWCSTSTVSSRGKSKTRARGRRTARENDYQLLYHPLSQGTGCHICAYTVEFVFNLRNICSFIISNIQTVEVHLLLFCYVAKYTQRLLKRDLIM